MSEYATTERLHIYRTWIPTGFDGPRWIYNAIDPLDVHCGVTVTAIVGPGQTYDYLWWIETASLQRRRGYAAELVQWLRSEHPTIVIEGGSTDGDHFVKTQQTPTQKPKRRKVKQ